MAKKLSKKDVPEDTYARGKAIWKKARRDREELKREALREVDRRIEAQLWETKREAYMLVHERGLRKSWVCEGMEISTTTLYRWLSEVEESGVVLVEESAELDVEKYTYSLNNRNYIRVTNNHAPEGDVRTLTLYTQHAHIAEFREDKVDERGDRQWQAGERYLKLEEWPDWFKSDLEEILRGSQVLGDIGVRDSEVAEIMWDYGAKLANEGMEVPEGWM